MPNFLNKSFLRLSFLFFAAFLFFNKTEGVSAATYYVNGSGSSYAGTQGTYGVGNDTTGNGSLATPWATLSGAEGKAAVQDGDTIYAAPATYPAWTLAKRLSWISDGTATIQATGTTAVYIASTKDITLNGFTIDLNAKTFGVRLASGGGTNTISVINSNIIGGATNSQAFRWDVAGNLTVSGGSIQSSNVLAYSFFFNAGGNISISGLNHTAKSAVFMIDGNGALGTVSATNNTLNYISSGNVFHLSGSSNVTISSNTVTLSGTPASFVNMTTLSKTGAVTISDNTVTYSSATSSAAVINITGTSHAVNVLRNTFYAQGPTQAQSIIALTNQTTPEVSDNIIYTNGSSNNVAHIYIVSTGTNVGVAKVYRNQSYSTSINGQVILVGYDVTSAGNNKLDGSEIVGNKVYGPLYYDRTIAAAGTHAIEFGWNKDGKIEKNYVNGSPYGIVVKGGGDDYLGQNGVRYNTLIDVGGTVEDATNSNIRIKGVSNVPVYQNTIYLSSGYYAKFGAIHITENFDDTVNHYPATGTLIKNNIFMVPANVKTINLVNDGSSIVASDVDYNIHYTQTGLGFSTNIGATAYSAWSGAGSWQTAGYDAHGYFTNPLFLSSSNYNLQSISPAIDSGVDVSLISDYSSNSTYGLPDIGSYEYQPSFTFAANNMPITGSARLYSNGQYRMIIASTTTDVASFSVAPVGGYMATTTQYMDINIDSWLTTGTKNKQWRATSTSDSLNTLATSTVYTIGDLASNTYYIFKLDGVASSTAITGYGSTACAGGVCLSNSSGAVQFTYSGGYSNHIFSLEKDITAPAGFTLISPSDGGSATAGQLFSWNASSDAESGLAKYQLYIDDALNTDNISGSANSAISNSISCGSAWHIRAVDNNGNYIDSNTFKLSTLCGYGGGGGGGGISSSVTASTQTSTAATSTTVITAAPIAAPASTLESIQSRIASVISEVADLPKNPASSVLISIQTKILSIMEELRRIQSSQSAGSFVFTFGLYQGLQNNEVRNLQQVLKQDPTIYPEGLVTGYFGPATLMAVKRFQNKYNIAFEGQPGYGYVGPKTREALNGIGK